MEGERGWTGFWAPPLKIQLFVVLERDSVSLSVHTHTHAHTHTRTQVTCDTSQYSTSIHIWGRRKKTWKPATRGKSEHCYLQVGFSFVRVLWTGMVDGCKQLPLIPKFGSLSTVIESYYGFKPIPNLKGTVHPNCFCASQSHYLLIPWVISCFHVYLS
jgi:hypothetical protein